MTGRKVTINIPEPIYQELEKRSKRKVEKYLLDIALKVSPQAKPTAIRNIFDLFASRKPLSVDHDEYIYR